MKKSKKIPKYNFGGLNDKDKQNVKDFAGNYAKYLLDNTANAVGIDAVGAGKGMEYKGTSANKFNQVSNVTGAAMKAAAPMVANAIVPGSGQLVSMGQQAAGGAYSQFGPQNEQGFNAYDDQGNPIVNEGDKSAQVGQVVGQVGTMVGGFMGGSPGAGAGAAGAGAAAGMFAKYGGQMKYKMGGMNMRPNAIPQYPNGGTMPRLKPRNFAAEKANYEEATRGANQGDGSGISSAELAYKYSKLIDPTGATSAVEIGKNFYTGNAQDPIDYLGLIRIPFVKQGMKPLSKLEKQGNKASVLNNIITKSNDVAESFSYGGVSQSDVIHAPEMGGYFRKKRK